MRGDDETGRAQRLRQQLAPHIALTPADAERMSQYSRDRRYARGALLHHGGVRCTKLLFIVEGVVRSFEAGEITDKALRLIGPPDPAVSYSSLITGAPAIETLQAITPVSGIELDFLAYAQENPSLLTQQLRAILAEGHFLAMERRVRMLQIPRAEDRYRFFLEQMSAAIVAQTPAQIVAAYIGITPESLSRVKRALVKQG